MAIGNDFSVNANGDIRHQANSNHYTVLELHRWLQDLADDQQASSDDLIDITTLTPSDRSTDNIITLNDYSSSSGPTYNIDDIAAQYFYAGSITQKDGDEIYSGLRVLGAVNDTDTQLMVIQDNDNYQFTPTPASPFWGTQATGGYNGNVASGILMRILIKSRVNGADIDQKQIRVQARHWGDSYDFFNVTLGQGESVAAIGTTPDAQNDTLQATVTAYTHVTNSGGTANDPTGGYQLIDIGDGNGDQPYYSQWTFGADTSGDGLKGVYEYLKDLTGIGTLKTNDSLDGEFFLGITHEVSYDNEVSGPFSERERVVWGTEITYDNLTGGTFTRGDYVVFGDGAAGRIVYDNGSTQMTVALEDISISIVNNETITEYDPSTGASGVTATVDSTIVNNNKEGGEALLLALQDDGTTGKLWIQLLYGTAPVDNLPLRGITSSATADTNGAPTSRTVPKMFLGSYTGSLIGAYGIGIDPNDLSASDSVQDLDGDTNYPPNNVTFTVQGLVSGQDRVLVGWREGATDDFDKNQLSLNTTLSGATETAVVTTTAIPSDTPSTGTIRIELDSGIYKYQEYTSWTGSTFTIASTDFTGDSATAGNNVWISYIDTLADDTSEAFTVVYNTSRTLWIRVRDGGTTPIKTFETAGTLGSGGGSATAIRTTDA